MNATGQKSRDFMFWQLFFALFKSRQIENVVCGIALARDSESYKWPLKFCKVEVGRSIKLIVNLTLLVDIAAKLPCF